MTTGHNVDHVRPNIIVIDNYDSFVYILVQYLGELGARPTVHRHDVVTVEQIRRFNPAGILISPGPGHPKDAGVSNDVLTDLSGEIPIFGVCLGLQCIAETFGGRVMRAPTVMHGKVSMINHDGSGVFQGLPNPLKATRYHSLIAERSSVPSSLKVTATTDDELVMGLRHRELPVEGVQFHPESVLTDKGHVMLQNFINICG